jgi:hypothetical protein
VDKLIYPEWKSETLDGDGFREALLGAAPLLQDDANVCGLRITVADSAVAAAAEKRMDNSKPLPDGVVSIWVNNAATRQPLETILAQQVARYTSYLVTEAEPIVNLAHPGASGERVYGLCQVVFLRRPPRLSEEDWLAIWQGSHGQIAIDTQSTFGYRQNVIVRAMSYAPPPFDAMIEENFPPEAMSSDYAFYGVAEGDEEGLQANLQAMLESCARFIDFDKIDVIPMSEYVFRAPGAV